MNSQEARLSEVCPGCNKPKALELVVCWHCFKYRTDKTPLKYFEGQQNDSLQEWLDYIWETNSNSDCEACETCVYYNISFGVCTCPCGCSEND